MSGFEFVFVLYSLLLGLSLVELLTGFGKALELRLTGRAEDGAFRIGWLTPLLGVFVLLDLLSFWSFAWLLRDQVEVSTRLLLGVVVFASAYFMAARLVFPSSPDPATDFDTHYFAVRRTVLGVLIALLAVQWLYLASLPAMTATLSRPLTIAMTLLMAALMIGAMVARARRWSIAILALLILRYVYTYALR